MHTIEIPDKDHTIHIPSHWDECTDSQRDRVLQLAFQTSSGQISMLDFRVESFCHLADLDMTISFAYSNAKGRANLINERIILLANELCAWPFRETDQGFELQYDTILNHYPVITSDHLKLFGPDHLIANITYAEFRWAIDHMNEYFDAVKAQQVEPAITALHSFLACLYRPNYNGARKAFEADEIPQFAQYFIQVPAYIKHTILLWFTQCLTTIQTTPIMISGAEVDFSVLFPKTDTDTSTDDTTQHKTKKGLGWHGLLYDIAEAHIFGDLKASDQANLFMVLTYLVKKHHEAEDQKRKIKNLSKKK